MRAPTFAAALSLTLAVAPAVAQTSPSSNLNSINNSLTSQGQSNAAQQQRTTGANNQMMQNNRNQMSQPAPTGPSGPIVAPSRR